MSTIKTEIGSSDKNEYVAASRQDASMSPGFLPVRYVLERYHVSQMTLWRWMRDEAMAFPAPLYLGRIRYWRIADLEAWEAARAERGRAA